jgi:predicted HicB family RNase H-like nuclease
MASLFDDLTDGIRDGINFVVDKTDEYSKIGKLKLDMVGIKRNIEKLFAELGGRVYEVLKEGESAVLRDDEEVKRMINEIKALEDNLDEKKNEIKSIRDEKERQRKERDTDATRSGDIVDVDVVEEEETPKSDEESKSKTKTSSNKSGGSKKSSS